MAIKNSFDLDIVLVNVPDCPIQELMASAYGEKVEDVINENIRGLINNPGPRYMGIWKPGKSLISSRVRKLARSMTFTKDGVVYRGRPGTFQEMVSFDFDSINSNDMDKETLVALHEGILIGDCDHVAQRVVYTCGYGLHLCPWPNVWSRQCRFLIVFEEVIE